MTGLLMECQFCHEGLKLEKICGQLHSVVNKTCYCVAHQKCMQYSSNLPQFQFPQFGGFYIEDVEKEVKRGQKLKCRICKRKGATAGCALRDCKQTFHYPCARKDPVARTRRLRVKYSSQGTDTKSAIQFCVFCNSLHESTYTAKLSLASEDEFSSDHSEDILDNANCVVEDVPVPIAMELEKCSLETSSTSANKSAAEGNISILDSALSSTPSPACHVDQKIVDSASTSDCRRDRLSLKSSQKKRKTRETDCGNGEATQSAPLQQDKEFLDGCLNRKLCNKRARIDSSPETLSNKCTRVVTSLEILSETETKVMSLSSAETLRLKNGCVGESDCNNGVLPTLDIPDPLDDQVNLKQPKNLKNNSALSLQSKRAKMSQPMITSFLTPAKKLDKTVKENCATEISMAKKANPKAQKRLRLSGTDVISNRNGIRTDLIDEAEKIQHNFNPLPSCSLPIADMTVSPLTEIVSAAKDALVSLGLEDVGNPSKNSTRMSDIPELALSPRSLKQNPPSTIRKLVLDGRGNCSVLIEIKSLFQPLSDSSNDSSDCVDSHDTDSGDMDWNTTTTLSTPSYEDLSSTCFLHQMEDKADIDRVFGICIPIIEDSLDARTSKQLLKYGIRSLNLVEENIFLWQISGLNEIQIISVILQFSRYLRNKDEFELLKKLFIQDKFDADSLLCNEISFTKENVKAIHQEIEQNFSEAEKMYGRCMGKLCSFDNPRISAAFFLLNNTNDKTRAVRSSLPAHRRVHVCSKDTKFVISHKLCNAQRILISDIEYENLKWWLETFDYSTVLLYPTEDILQASDVAPSVTNRLKNYFLQRTVPGGDTSFVFIQRTNPDLLIYRSFICKMLAFVKEEILTCKHDACIVFDVGQDLSIEGLADVVMSCLVGEQSSNYCFEVETCSGVNPVFSPVSCLVVHLVLTFPDNC